MRAIISEDSNYAAATSNPIRIDFVYPRTFTVTYAKNSAIGSLEKFSETYQQGRTALTLPGVGGLAKNGYSFQGWSESGSTPAITGAYTPTGNVTLKALWEPITYQITYDANDGDSTPTSLTKIVGDTVVLADPITKSSSSGISYQFAGWKSGDSIYEAGETVRVGNSDLTFTAVWVRQYEVTYLANGGVFSSGDTEKDSECALSICNNNQGITLNTAPYRPGYTFAGWEVLDAALASDTDTETPGIQTTVAESRYIFTASWQPIPYSITYESNGSTAPTQSSLNSAEIFRIGSAVTRTDYTFDGWSDGTTTYWPDSDYQVGTSDISLTAQWINVLHPYDGTNGTVACSVAGNFTISESVVTATADCEGAVVMPEGITNIMTELFKDNSFITSLVIPNTMAGIGTNSFINTTALSSYIYCGTELIDEDLSNASLETKTRVCTSLTSRSSANIGNPPQTSSISGAIQSCSTQSTTIIVKGSFLVPIVNIAINNRLIDSTQWTQSATQIEITISSGALGTLSVDLFNGQFPLLSTQSIVLSAACGDLATTSTEVQTPAKDPKPTTDGSLIEVPVSVKDLTKSLKYLDSVYFATGSARLTLATQKTLRAIAVRMQSSSTLQVLSLGHADSRGNISFNKALSRKRSAAVIAFLKVLNPRPEYLLRWYGTSRPAGKGNSASDLAKNRRVEIWHR